MTDEKTTCAVDGCEHGGPYCRGLCNSHYQRVSILKKRYGLSWVDCELAGLVQPAVRKHNNKKTQPYFADLTARMIEAANAKKT